MCNIYIIQKCSYISVGPIRVLLPLNRIKIEFKELFCAIDQSMHYNYNYCNRYNLTYEYMASLVTENSC
jgi:hypothetical protein